MNLIRSILQRAPAMPVCCLKRFVFGMVLLASVEVFSQATNSVSGALEELFGRSQTPLDPAAGEEPLYLVVVPSRTQPRSTVIYRCRHVTADSIVYAVESATSPTGTVETSDDQNMITINDVNEQIDELIETVLALDRRGPQVLVEAHIVEVQMGEGSELDSAFNVSYFDKDKDATSTIGSVLGGTKGYPDDARGGYPEESGAWFNLFPFNKELSNGDIIKINARLKWLRSNDKAEILSSPNLLVDLGTTATVSTGTDQPLLSVSVNNGVSQEEVYYKRTGVNLRVTPLLVNSDTVTIEVRPEVTSVVGYASLSSSSQPPIISVRNIETKLNVRDGGVVMMGGLYSSKDIKSVEKVPFFGDIPLLGHLFRSESTDQAQVQLVFLLRVSIISDAPRNVLGNMDATQREVRGVGAILESEIAPPPPAEDAE
jgi:type II secretory pathway component GspD/PulD (secretin)